MTAQSAINNNQSNDHTQAPSPSQPRRRRRRRHHDIPGLIGSLLAQAVSFPINLASGFLDNFIDVDGPGIRALGGLALICGITLGADNFYQLFTGQALLPWFTEAPWVGDKALESLPWFIRWMPNILGGKTLIGWSAVALNMFSFGFLFCAALSLVTQFIQGKTWRTSLDKKRLTFERWAAENLPERPGKDSLKMAKIAYDEYRNAGVAAHRRLGFMPVVLWGFEFVSAFAAHWPINYWPQWGQMFACTLYALLTIGAGELGYVLYCATDSTKAEA